MHYCVLDLLPTDLAVVISQLSCSSCLLYKQADFISMMYFTDQSDSWMFYLCLVFFCEWM